MPRHPWKSTKLHLALIAMALLTAVYARAGFPVAQFSDYCMWLIAATGIYSGTAAAEKFVRPPVQTPGQP